MCSGCIHVISSSQLFVLWFQSSSSSGTTGPTGGYEIQFEDEGGHHRLPDHTMYLLP